MGYEHDPGTHEASTMGIITRELANGTSRLVCANCDVANPKCFHTP